MAFSRTGVQVTVTSGEDDAPKTFTYKSSDTLATIKASGYFNDIEAQINTGDFMQVYSSAASGGGASTINLTNTSGTITTGSAADLS